jgi:hypothetical protein
MVPIVNEVIALLLDAAAALSDGMAPRFALDDMIAPPAVVLSHDCDVLNGNDYITQAIQIYRIFQPLGRGRLPKFGLLPTIAENFLDPHRVLSEGPAGHDGGRAAIWLSVGAVHPQRYGRPLRRPQ